MVRFASRRRGSSHAGVAWQAFADDRAVCADRCGLLQVILKMRAKPQTRNTFPSCTPIFFEAAIEASHPLPQGGVITLMTVLFNLFSIAILAVPSSASAFNWMMSAAAAAVALLMIILYENQSNRSKLDVQT